MNFLVLASLFGVNSLAAASILNRVPSEERLSSCNSSLASLMVSSSSNTAISTPTIEDSSEVLARSPLGSPFMYRKTAEIEELVRASNTCIVSDVMTAECLDELLRLLRDGSYLEDVFHTIIRFEYHNLAYYAALHNESMAWYFIVTFIENPLFNPQIITLLDSYPLLLITVRRKFISEAAYTSVCKLATENNNQGIYEFCFDKLGKESYKQLLNCCDEY